MSNTIYCTYLTIYKGNKLPPFYIGSTSVDKINKGYRGSVESKKYKQMWKFEISNNPQLFKTYIISTHNTREEALEKELFLQEKLNVVHSSMYINQSYARINGYFGVSVFGKNHPSHGKIVSQETRNKQSLAKKGRKLSKKQCENMSKLLQGNQYRKGIPHTKETRDKMSASHTGIPRNDTFKQTISNKLKNKPKSPQHKENLRLSWITRKQKCSKICPHCNRTIVVNYSRYHGDNCKLKSQ